MSHRLLSLPSSRTQEFASKLKTLKNRHFEDSVYSKTSENLRQLLVLIDN